MTILKFGGTSVGSAESIRNVKEIIRKQEGAKIVVVSAMSGVTNLLFEVAAMRQQENNSEIRGLLEYIQSRHLRLIEDLFSGPKKQEILKEFTGQFEELKRMVSYKANVSEAAIVTQGESLLSFIFSRYLDSEHLPNRLLDAKKFMVVPNLENPDIERVEGLLRQHLNQDSSSDLYVTQGFVRLDQNNHVSTLKRGGSDYSATIIGAALGVSEVQIWTDIDGFHNNDPRHVEHTTTIEELSFEEAAELAYFGAKILHPQTVAPAKERNIPIYLKNTFTPESAGTRISSKVQAKGLKAISAKDGITAIKIKSNRMLMAHGFLKKIFEVFDKHETAIDMITTSEIAISLTIDDPSRLHNILDELDQYGEISVDTQHTIICIVGEEVIHDKETFRLFEILNDIPVRMISYGGSRNNISLLVETRNKVKALQILNRKLFQEKYVPQF